MPSHRMIFQFSPSVAYRIPDDRYLYLDTSAIRRMGTRLWEWQYRDRCYTSVLALIELLNGITRSEKDFRFRRSALAGVFGGDVPIDWQMPQFRLRCAFPPLRAQYDIYEKRTECAEKLLHCLFQCSTATQFAREHEKLSLEYDLEYFGGADDSISRAHINAARKWVPFNRQQFNDPSTADFLVLVGLPVNASIAELAAMLGGSDFDFGLGIYAYTRQFASEDKEYIKSFHDQLFRSYDGSIDLYIRATSYQQWKEIGWNAMPGRNTGADLEHLLYVSPGSHVVTTDVGMATAIRQAGGIAIGEEALNPVG